MELAVANWKEIRPKRENDFGLENALAGYVRRRWPDKTIPHVQHEFDLSESEAAKVVYAGASKKTLNKLLHHRRGGFGLFLQLIEDVTATKLAEYITQQAQRAENERRTWEAEERRLAIIAARVSGPGGVLGRASEQAGAGRPGHAPLGSGADGAPGELIRPNFGGES